MQGAVWSLFSGGLPGWSPNSAKCPHEPAHDPSCVKRGALHSAAIIPELHSKDFNCYRFSNLALPLVESLLLFLECEEMCNNLESVKNGWILSNNSNTTTIITETIICSRCAAEGQGKTIANMSYEQAEIWDSRRWGFAVYPSTTAFPVLLVLFVTFKPRKKMTQGTSSSLASH